MNKDNIYNDSNSEEKDKELENRLKEIIKNKNKKNIALKKLLKALEKMRSNNSTSSIF